MSATNEIVHQPNLVDPSGRRVSIAAAPSVKSVRSVAPVTEKSHVSRVSQRSVKSVKSQHSENSLKSNKSAKSIKSVKSTKLDKSNISQKSASQKSVSQKSASQKSASQKPASQKSASQKSTSQKSASQKSASQKSASKALSQPKPELALDATDSNVAAVAIPVVPLSVTRRSVSAGVEHQDPAAIPAVVDDEEGASQKNFEDMGEEHSSQGTRCSGGASQKSRKSSRKSMSRASASHPRSGIVDQNQIDPAGLNPSEHHFVEGSAPPIGGATALDYTEFYEDDDNSMPHHSAGKSAEVELINPALGQSKISNEDVNGVEPIEQSKVSNGDFADVEDNVSRHSALVNLASAPEQMIATDGPVNIVNLTARQMRPCHSGMGSVKSEKTHKSRSSGTVKSATAKASVKAPLAARCVRPDSRSTSAKPTKTSSKSDKCREYCAAVKDCGSHNIAGNKPNSKPPSSSSRAAYTHTERMSNTRAEKEVGRMQPTTSHS